jgi:hypothetical protein
MVTVSIHFASAARKQLTDLTPKVESTLADACRREALKTASYVTADEADDYVRRTQQGSTVDVKEPRAVRQRKAAIDLKKNADGTWEK